MYLIEKVSQLSNHFEVHLMIFQGLGAKFWSSDYKRKLLPSYHGGSREPSTVEQINNNSS